MSLFFGEWSLSTKQKWKNKKKKRKNIDVMFKTAKQINELLNPLIDEA